jgi:uncharacterized membrane protein YdbT with pleckstrin-like domain
MASYVDRSLTKGEEVVYRGQVTRWRFWPLYLFGVLLLPLAIPVPALLLCTLAFFLIAGSARKCTELAITNKRVISKRGLIDRTTMEMNIEKVESIQVRQGVFGRMCNFGSLIISGAGNPLEGINGVVNPMKFRRVCLETQEDARDRSRRAA